MYSLLQCFFHLLSIVHEKKTNDVLTCLALFDLKTTKLL